ncbi:3-isopropylmalate dehydratase large subunit [Glycocaulis abyssi]|uniref:3-isopropylmalate dehydratase large subunit n=1 Tax=Glycocaulis abyssi TaxID=1433403 RepID=A0ABV9NF68_9PROT
MERASPSEPRTLFDKLWDSHIVMPESPEAPAMLYVDLHLVHEVTSPQAFAMLDERGLKVRAPQRTFATLDHSTPTTPRRKGQRPAYISPAAKNQVERLEENCARHGIPLAGWGSSDRGIVHVMGPELGLTQPGMTIVCGDSHTSTHGAFGALAFGIGTTEVAHVLATQTVLQRKPKTMKVHVDGRLPYGVGAKDLILAIIAKLGAGGASGHVIEYCGPAIEALSMEGRMTVCNMSIEAGARAGLIAPDEVTFAWLSGREYAPKGAAFEAARLKWKQLRSDPGASFDREVRLDASRLAPMVTWGASPHMAAPVDAMVPAPGTADDVKALAWMGFTPGETLMGEAVHTVFVGSCTNARLSDLREAAFIMAGRHVKPGVRMLVVPGSERVRKAAEAEGLDAIFRTAGAEWREPGCSMCIAMNGDSGRPGELVVSTSNRNFAGRQGPGVRTVLASPATAAAAAVAGAITDPRKMMEMCGAA